MTIAKVFQSGDGQAVQLPHGYEFTSEQVAIRKEGQSVIIEPIKPSKWPDNFFESIRIEDPAFERPSQGPMPPSPVLTSK
jgi:virulence-associated protein VagC